MKILCKASAALMLAFLLTAALAAAACAATKTFEDYVPYSLETFLNGYNAIAFEDAEMYTHCMGGVIIGGDFTTHNYLGFADGSGLPPSFIGGYAKYPSYSSRNASGNVPLLSALPIPSRRPTPGSSTESTPVCTY